MFTISHAGIQRAIGEPIYRVVAGVRRVLRSGLVTQNEVNMTVDATVHVARIPPVS